MMIEVERVQSAHRAYRVLRKSHCLTSHLMLISLLWHNTTETYKELTTLSAQLLRNGQSRLWTCGPVEIKRATMTSKLARQMAYKKRLEEEYREFQERCKVRQIIINIIIYNY